MKKILMLSILCVMAVSAFSQQRPYEVFVSEDISYDDNIYLTDNNAVDSAISVTTIGGKYVARIPNSGLDFTANAFGAYNYYTEDNGKNGFWAAGANLELKNEAFKLSENFIYTSDPANSELTDRAKRYGNIAAFYMQTSNKKPYNIALKVTDKYDHYIDAGYKFLTRNRLDAGAELHYNPSARTTVFAEYMWADISYKDNRVNESNENIIGIGARGDLFNKLSGAAGIRYSMRDYDHSLGSADENETLLGYYANLKWDISSQTAVGLSGQRVMEETLFGDNRFYVSTLVEAFVSQKIRDRFTAALTLGYENMDYRYDVNGKKRDDDLYKVRPSVDYNFNNWLSAGVWYQYKLRASDSQAYEYANNKAGVFVKAIF